MGTSVIGGRGMTKKRRGKVKSRDMYKGPMVKDNGLGIGFGSGDWMGQGRAMVGKMGTTVTEKQLKKECRLCIKINANNIMKWHLQHAKGQSQHRYL